MMQSLRRVFMLAFGLFLVPSLLFGQRERGSIVGRITDSSGAVIPAVAIKVTNINTGVEYTTQTTEEGIYNVPTLPIGTYRVEVQKQGFKTALAENIEVSVAQQVTIDLTLQVGEVAEQVTVTSEAPLLDLTSPEVGSIMKDKLYHELPNPVDETRDPSAFLFNSLPGTTGNTFLGSINGGQLFSHEVLVDGITSTRYDLMAGADSSEFAPPVDGIEEFKLQTDNYSAALGGTQGAIFSLTTKSGTNDFHGNVYEYYRGRALDAAGWNVNTYAPNGVDSNGKAVRGFRLHNNFGGTIGGPIIIPKLYNGKNKTFFFFAYDRLRSLTRIAASPLTTPTTDQLGGDFGRFLNLNNEVGRDMLGRPIFQGEVYDPATTRPVTAGQVDPATGLVPTQSGTIRDAFGFDPKTGQPTSGQANIIPKNRWSQVSSNVVPFFSTIQHLNNNLFRNTPSSGYGGFGPKDIKYWTIKLDHIINDKHKLSSSFNYNSRPRDFGGIFYGGGPLNLDQFQTTEGRIVRITEDWMISNHWLNSFRVGFNRFHNFLYPDESIYNKDWASQIGLTGLGSEHFPELGFAGNTGFTCFFGVSDLSLACGGEAQNYDYATETYILLDDMSYTRGKHTFKWGGEARRYRENTRPQAYSSGSFYWSNAQTSLPGFQTPIGGGLFETGWPFASFLLGTAESASRPIYGTFHGYRQSLYALYFQDDWRTSAKLTLNFGLRWDIPTPQKEAHSRFSNFDPTVPNPGADNIPGALVFLQNVGRESFQDSYYREFGPRFGFAYQLTGKTVLRGGYGIAYSPPLDNGTAGNTEGFNSQVAVNHGTSDPRFGPAPNPWDPVLQWDNGVPPFQGKLPNTDPAQANFDRAGSFVGWQRRDSLRQAYGQNWSFGIQRELFMDSVLETNYVGSKGTRLNAGLFSNHINAVPTRFMALVDANGNELVNKTFADLTPGDLATLSAAGFKGKPYPSFPDTVPISQALKRFPQYAGVHENVPNHGSSTYHSLQVSWRKRPTHGLTFISSYTFSKLLTNAAEIAHPALGIGFLNGYSDFVQWSDDRRLERSVADFDIPHSLKLTYSYELPIGQGKRFLNRGGVVEKLLGGWKITGIQNYSAGIPLNITSYVPAAISTDGGFGGRTRVDIRGDASSIKGEVGGPLDPIKGTPYLNVPTQLTNGCAGPFCAVPTTADGYALRPGNAARYFSNIRGPGSQSESFGIIKEIRIREKTSLEIVANFFNAFNRHGFGRPDTFLGSPTFGRIISAAYGPRSIQFAARLNF